MNPSFNRLEPGDAIEEAPDVLTPARGIAYGVAGGVIVWAVLLVVL